MNIATLLLIAHLKLQVLQLEEQLASMQSSTVYIQGEIVPDGGVIGGGPTGSVLFDGGGAGMGQFTTPLIGNISNATSIVCPIDDDVPDGPPNPCNPYAFKLSNCPPTSTIQIWNKDLSQGEVPYDYQTWRQIYTASDTVYCGIIPPPGYMGPTYFGATP